jgi:hypothetical protein
MRTAVVIGTRMTTVRRMRALTRARVLCQPSVIGLTMSAMNSSADNARNKPATA